MFENWNYHFYSEYFFLSQVSKSYYLYWLVIYLTYINNNSKINEIE